MATANLNNNPTILLTLSKKEAHWLTGIMQNPLHCDYPDNEDSTSKQYRTTIFQALYKLYKENNIWV